MWATGAEDTIFGKSYFIPINKAANPPLEAPRRVQSSLVRYKRFNTLSIKQATTSEK